MTILYGCSKTKDFYVCAGEFRIDDTVWVGKTVFLTRAEAEDALKEVAKNERQHKTV